MSALPLQIKARFAQLEVEGSKIPLRVTRGDSVAEEAEFHAWAASALNLVAGVFGNDSPHFESLNKQVTEATNGYIVERKLNACRGVFRGAKADADGDFVFRLETQIAGEVFGDFVSAAKLALGEGKHEVAAVLASAALEDALKRFAMKNGMDMTGKTMDEVVGALKSKGLVGGTQKGLLSSMPKVRNAAMHADWTKLTPQDVGSIVGFTEQFLLANF
jgi:hypothetical protein